MTAVVEVTDLTVRIPTVLLGRPAVVSALTEVSTTLEAGRVRALVGESGCGKSILGSAVIGMLPPGTSATGSVRVTGHEVLSLAEAQWRRLRGRVIGLVTQSAATSLTPTRTVGAQLVETLTALDGTARPDELMARVGLDAGALTRYPHELSGGMAQRAAVAFALAGNPRVLIADEPTASLDPELTDHVLGLLRECADDGAAVLVITHDLRSLERTGTSDDLMVMYAGRVVEQGPTERVLSSPEDAYTRALIAALPEHGMTPIPGLPPSLTDLDPDLTFADRLRSAR